MAAPTATYVQLPTDAGNSGKKMRTIQRTVGADTVLEHYFIPGTPRQSVGHYRVHGGPFTVVATAHTWPAGFMWFATPVGTANKMALERIRICSQHGSALATPTSPRIAISQFTFTGTFSGASLTPAKLDSTYAASAATVRTANTGATIAAEVARLFGPMVTSALTAVGGVPLSAFLWDENDWDKQPIVRAGEGVAIWQCDNGTTSDTRRVTVDLQWEEFE
jgi:hypothetical protein